MEGNKKPSRKGILMHNRKYLRYMSMSNDPMAETGNQKTDFLSLHDNSTRRGY